MGPAGAGRATGRSEDGIMGEGDSLAKARRREEAGERAGAGGFDGMDRIQRMDRVRKRGWMRFMVLIPLIKGRVVGALPEDLPVWVIVACSCPFVKEKRRRLDRMDGIGERRGIGWEGQGGGLGLEICDCRLQIGGSLTCRRCRRDCVTGEGNGERGRQEGTGGGEAGAGCPRASRRDAGGTQAEGIIGKMAVWDWRFVIADWGLGGRCLEGRRCRRDACGTEGGEDLTGSTGETG